MVEEMYQHDVKEEDAVETATAAASSEPNSQNQQKNSISARTSRSPAPPPLPPPPPPASQRSQINAQENDPSLDTINYRNCFSGTQAITQATSASPTTILTQSFPTTHQRTVPGDDTWCRGSVFGREYGNGTNTTHDPDSLRSGTPTAGGGDVSLTLGLRHAGNLPDKGRLSLRDFGAC